VSYLNITLSSYRKPNLAVMVKDDEVVAEVSAVAEAAKDAAIEANDEEAVATAASAVKGGSEAADPESEEASETLIASPAMTERELNFTSLTFFLLIGRCIFMMSPR
jgi:hypothetical protein